MTAPANPPYPTDQNSPHPQGGYPQGAPYPQQGGPQPQGAPFPPPVAPPAAPPRKKSAGRLVGLIVLLVVVVVVGVIGWFASRDDVKNAKVGDCVKGGAITSTTAQDASDVKVVDCTSADAKYKVVGIVADKTQAEFANQDSNPCEAYASATAAIWWGNSGKKGSILCLEDK